MQHPISYIIEYIGYFCLLTVIISWMSRKLNITPAQHRYQTLDGVRGVCATLVMIYHLFYRVMSADDETWTMAFITDKAIELRFCITGELSVGFFFMLSGFLFFRKALSANLNVGEFFIGRFKRIYIPVLVTLVVIYCVTYLIGPGPTEAFLPAIARTLPFLTAIDGTGMNGVGGAPSGPAVLWTLVWEARLYCLVPLLYWAMKPLTRIQKQGALVFLMVAVHITNTQFLPHREWAYVMFFLGGFLIATIETEKKVSSWVGLLILVAALHFTQQTYHTTTALYMTVVFYTIKCGCDYFGFLTSRPIALLGTCSFSIYILHGVIEYVAKHFLYAQGHYVWQIASVIGVGIFAPLMYHFVERRCIS